jgi:predicted Zn-dependent protease
MAWGLTAWNRGAGGTQGNVTGARALLEAGTKADPTNVFLWSACGVFETRQGRLDTAIRMFQQVPPLPPMLRRGSGREALRD